MVNLHVRALCVCMCVCACVRVRAFVCMCVCVCVCETCFRTLKGKNIPKVSGKREWSRITGSSWGLHNLYYSSNVIMWITSKLETVGIEDILGIRGNCREF
jgi:hypothetical protein